MRTTNLKRAETIVPATAAIAACPFDVGNTAPRRLNLSLNGVTHEIWLKEERQNAFGSIKDRVAWYLLYHARLQSPEARHFIDASSGNYGYALASIGHALELRITIVSSPSISAFNAAGIRSTGAELIIAEPHAGETANAARMRVAGEIAKQTGACFLNQYENPLNPESHRVWTAPEVFADAAFDACFLTASSGGTGRGFQDYLAESRLGTKLFLVEPSGSQAFVDPVPTAERPSLPGYGTGRRSSFADVAHPPEMIRQDDTSVVAAFGIFQDRNIAPIGLSSIGVVLGAMSWLETQTQSRRIVCICADGDDRYVDEYAKRYKGGVKLVAFQSAQTKLAPILAKLTQEAGASQLD